jgi:DNA polymerase-3 subunit epsilon
MKAIVFDLETTGVDRINDHIIQFAALKIETDNNSIIDSKNIYIRPEGNYSISLGAYFKHKITPKFLEDKPTLREVGPEIVKFFNDDSVIITFNGNSFDIPFLKSALNKYNMDIDFIHKKVYDVFLEERYRNGNTLEATYKRYKGKSMEESGLTAHDAFSDIKATYSVYKAHTKTAEYQEDTILTEDSTIKIMEFDGKDVPCFNIGKYKCISLEYIAKVDQGYLNWCVSDKCNFLPSTKEYIKKYLK